jgi:hypothetical protein
LLTCNSGIEQVTLLSHCLLAHTTCNWQVMAAVSKNLRCHCVDNNTPLVSSNNTIPQPRLGPLAYSLPRPETCGEPTLIPGSAPQPVYASRHFPPADAQHSDSGMTLCSRSRSGSCWSRLSGRRYRKIIVVCCATARRLRTNCTTTKPATLEAVKRGCCASRVHCTSHRGF